MKLLLVCPQCRDRLPLASRSCPACGADLRDLPPQDRGYYLGPAVEVAAPPEVPEMLPGAVLAVMTEEVGEEFLEPTILDDRLAPDREVSLCEALDRILHKGAVLYGELMISVADIDLVYLGLQVVLSSMETARGLKPVFGEGQMGPNLFEKRVE